MSRVSITTRLVTLDDVPALAELVRTNREFLAPWEPTRDEAYYTDEAQGLLIADALVRHGQGTTLPHVIVDSGHVVGRITLNGIVRGPFQSCSVGYWVGAASNGRGVATAAVSHMIGVAFHQLRLHRLQAETLLYNVASQKVLERNGFTRFGLAQKYLMIDGEWRDHVMYQLLSPGA
jgi:ribosomal-protein-alanine N-acetyltransferase